MVIRASAAALAACFVISAFASAADRVSVKVVQRQASEASYNYAVPVFIHTTAISSANCYEASSTVNCSATTTTSGVTGPARSGSYSVRGATLSLLLLDGRVAVVNCESKYAPKGDYVNRRSCRTPPSNDIQAEFKGSNAKLFWPVSLDVRKLESETYKILAVIDASR